MSRRLSILTIALCSLIVLSLAAYVKNSLSKDASPQNDLLAVVATGSTSAGTPTSRDAMSYLPANAPTCCGGSAPTSLAAKGPVAATESSSRGTGTPASADTATCAAAAGPSCCGGGTPAGADTTTSTAAAGPSCCGTGTSSCLDVKSHITAAESTCGGTGTSTGADAKNPVAATESTDKELIAKQKICPVTGAPLGSMGNPVKVVVKDRTVFLCCAHCKAKFLAATDTYLKKLDEKK